MSDLEFKPNQKFSRVTISSTEYAKDTTLDIIALWVYRKVPSKITLRLGLLWYCKTNATFHPTQERAFRVNNTLKLLDICRSTVLNEDLAVDTNSNDSKQNTDYFTKFFKF